MICTKLLCANTFFYEDQLYIKLAKKICAKKKIICANEKKSASMKMLMPVLARDGISDERGRGPSLD